MKKTKTVEEYIARSGKWEEAVTLLREILLDTELTETVKWGAPAYVLGKKLLVGIGAFKAYAGVWFHQGALLADAEGKLINAQEGVTKALRQWRFQSADDIRRDTDIIKAYVLEAIANQKAGREIKPNKKKPLIIPPELQHYLEANPEVKREFEAFSLTKKREFVDYIREAKRADTKQKRLEKITPMILKGIGLGDKYRK